MDIELLRAAGIDYKAGVARFLGDQEVYESVLNTFLQDDTLEKGRQALQENDMETLFFCAHELKGACGNADMIDLYHSADALCARLRRETADASELEHLFAALEKDYLRAKDGIRRAQSL